MPLCALCGKREVPRAEWPADPLFPKVCDPCLRDATYKPLDGARKAGGATGAPAPTDTPTGPPARQEGASAEFGDDLADFGT